MKRYWAVQIDDVKGVDHTLSIFVENFDNRKCNDFLVFVTKIRVKSTKKQCNKPCNKLCNDFLENRYKIVTFFKTLKP